MNEEDRKAIDAIHERVMHLCDIPERLPIVDVLCMVVLSQNRQIKELFDRLDEDTKLPSIDELNNMDGPGPLNKTDCCYRCFYESSCVAGRAAFRDRMYLCPDCQNKRCPKATDHREECSE